MGVVTLKEVLTGQLSEHLIRNKSGKIAPRPESFNRIPAMKNEELEFLAHAIRLAHTSYGATFRQDTSSFDPGSCPNTIPLPSYTEDVLRYICQGLFLVECASEHIEETPFLLSLLMKKKDL